MRVGTLQAPYQMSLTHFVLGEWELRYIITVEILTLFSILIQAWWKKILLKMFNFEKLRLQLTKVCSSYLSTSFFSLSFSVQIIPCTEKIFPFRGSFGVNRQVTQIMPLNY